jgi:hypothetical protein
MESCLVADIVEDSCLLLLLLPFVLTRPAFGVLGVFPDVNAE